MCAREGAFHDANGVNREKGPTAGTLTPGKEGIVDRLYICNENASSCSIFV